MNFTAGHFTAAVLAGGRSIRMGTDKSLLRVGDELLIERQLRCLRECDPAELLVSGRMGIDHASLGVKVLYDEQPGAGPLSGLAAVLKAAACELVLVLAVDMPAMNSAMLRKILSHSKEDCGCVPVDDDGSQPLAATYPKTALALVDQQLAQQEYSMQAFVTQALAEHLVRPMRILPSEQSYFANWNYPSDWEEPSN